MKGQTDNSSIAYHVPTLRLSDSRMDKGQAQSKGAKRSVVASLNDAHITTKLPAKGVQHEELTHNRPLAQRFKTGRMLMAVHFLPSVHFSVTLTIDIGLKQKDKQ